MNCSTSDTANFFTTYIAPSASALIALLVVAIAYRQWKIAQEKLRLDLYDRRFDVYMRALDFLHLLHDWNETPVDERKTKRIAFIKACRESRFLFSKESGIFTLMNEMNLRSFKWTALDEIGKHAASIPQQFKASYDEGLENLNWIEVSLPDLEIRMEPYLNFHKLQPDDFIDKLLKLAEEDD